MPRVSPRENLDQIVSYRTTREVFLEQLLGKLAWRHAASVVLIYLKVVLLKHVKTDYIKKQQEQQSAAKKSKKG